MHKFFLIVATLVVLCSSAFAHHDSHHCGPMESWDAYSLRCD